MKHRNDSLRKLILAIIILTVLIGGVPFFIQQNYHKMQTEKKVSIVFVSKRLDDNNDFWATMAEGIRMAAAEYEIDIQLMGPVSEADYEQQNQMITEAIAMKPDAIALVPSDYKITIPYAKQIEEAGIKLVLMDSKMEEEMGMSLIATDNYEGGRKMGAYLKQYADAKTRIGIISQGTTVSTALDRERGVRAGLAEYEAMIEEVVYCYSDLDKAYQMTMDLLTKYPEINMLVGLNEDTSIGAARAVKDAGLSNQIRMIGFDSSLEQIQLLEEGVFDAIVVQKPLNMGYLGIKTAYQAVQNKPVEQIIDSGSKLITKDAIFQGENEKLLFPLNHDK